MIKVKSDCNWTRTQNHLVRKRTLNHLVPPITLSLIPPVLGNILPYVAFILKGQIG